MLRKKRLFILIPALLLIPILLGIIPLKMAHSLAKRGPLSPSSQGCSCAHSLVSHTHTHNHKHFDAVTVDFTPADQVLLYSQRALYAVPEFFHSHIHFSSIPLRC